MQFWNFVSRFILKGREFILGALLLITVFLALQIKNVHFSYTETNILPKNHIINQQYNRFLDIFGEEGNLILLAVKDSTLYQHDIFNQWGQLADQLSEEKAVDQVLSLKDIRRLKKDENKQTFTLEAILPKAPETDAEVLALKQELLTQLPFYESLMFKSDGTVQTLIYIDKSIVNTEARKRFVLDVLNPLVEQFEKNTGLDVKISGMPYIRSMNSANLSGEMNLFMALALSVTILIFYFFFRSWRATFITMFIVSIGVIWALGFMGLFGYGISVLTALIPPLLIVIGVPNAIFLINKYQQEIKKHGNKVRSLYRVISKIGTATLMTNLTTSVGFATFIFTKSQLLSEFGVIASVSILSVFVLSLFIIPIIYSYMPLPKERHLLHLEKKWINKIVNWLEHMVRNYRLAIFSVVVVLIVVSMIGVNLIHVSGSLIEDMPKNQQFTKDIQFFEDEFGGVMALEFLIDTKKKQGALKLGTFKKIEKLNELINEIPELSKPVSLVDAVKYVKQAFYNNNPEYYELPTSEEQIFLKRYIKNSRGNAQMLQSYVDSTGRYLRLTTYMKDIGTERMERIEERIRDRVNSTFPAEKYEVTLTGKALVFLKGTNYLIINLVITLGLTILLISIFMGWVFRSFPMILISLIPNILPLLITAGLMGYLGIPLKPSTILVFSVAFGISVDDTIHFLAKYRQELTLHRWRVNKSVYAALRETGVSMFYTSVVLFFGFLLFIVSSFGGTKAMGGLVSITLLVAMFSNLLLLPSLLLAFENKIANKRVLKKPSIDVLTDSES